MAERNYKENINRITPEIQTTDAITGGSDKRMHLYYHLMDSLQRAKSVDIIVSFLMESGVKLLLKELNNTLRRGAKIRILTGNYLGITQPSALYLIRQELGDAVDLRFYNDKSRAFHPKAYFFHYDTYSEIFIGSSNLSKSALTSGIEWNYRFRSNEDSKSYHQFYHVFEDLFEHHSIIIDDEELEKYSKAWHRPSVAKDFERYEDAKEETNVRKLYEPRGAQIEALYALENTRKEGASRALIQAATGIGKTYLAAFDSKKFNRVLFVAHREEILKQAAESFYHVRESDDYGFFDGKEKTTDKSVIFASVATLGQNKYLSDDFFASDYFDYIVMDEFHHAVTNQYQRILEYFKPKFLLGLTATPERMDQRNIYEICDYNVPFEISLEESINKGLLVPFHYYGIYDETDYSKLHVVHGRYDEKELNETYIGNVYRYDLIYKNFCKYRANRALGFCCSRSHAKEMAKEFSNRGIPAVAVYSNAEGQYTKERSDAIEQLKRGDIKVIFCVDMFNEGVDIPSIDTVMFLRPTESPVVFLQQLGRGLRKYKGKDYLTVLDFIGNYHKAGRIRFLLPGGTEATDYKRDTTSTFIPDECMIDFDFRLIDLFQELDKKKKGIQDIIYEEYSRIKDMLDKVPSRLELFTYMEEDTYQFILSKPKENIFKYYLEYLNQLGELTEEEKNLYQSIGREFISLIENTNMTKVYKMPVLMAFYNHGDIRMSVSNEQLLESWKEFFDTGRNYKDLEKDMTYRRYQEMPDKKHLQNILKNPVNFLLKSGKGFFVAKEGATLALNEDLADIIKSDAFKKHLKDAIEYRTMDYYQRRYKNLR